MRSRKDIEQTIRTKLNLTFDPPLRGQLLARALHEQKESPKKDPAPRGPVVRRMTMENSITKLGIAAAVFTVVGLGIAEFIGTGGTSGVVWAEVAQKMEANRGFTFHQRLRIGRSDRPDQIAYIVAYHAGSQMRQDFSRQPEGEVLKSDYSDFDAKTTTYIRHDEKTYLRVPINGKTLQAQQSGWLNPKDWVRQFLSGKYTKLGRKTIEGVQCEGIETRDPAFGGGDPPPTGCVGRLWVNVETGYPVQLEYNSVGPTTRGDSIQLEVLCGQFQWDVELSSDLFEPNIPDDYTLVEQPTRAETDQ